MKLVVVVLFLLYGTSWTTTCQTRKKNPKEDSPTLEIRPRRSDGSSDLIWISPNNEKAIEYWKNDLHNFMEPYYYVPSSKVSNSMTNIYECDWDMPPPKNRFCYFDVKQLYPCVKESNYMYDIGKSGPCIFLRLTDFPKNWLPTAYNSTNAPKHMPNFLKDKIRLYEEHKRQMVWLSCDGENPIDMENIGPIRYIPDPGFPVYTFLSTDAEGYLSPIVAVLFERATRGIVINVRCKVWAKNIPLNSEDMVGVVNFELMIQ